MSSLRIGIASFAHVHAEGYARLLAGRHDVEVVVTDPDGNLLEDETRGRVFAERLGLEYLPSYAAMFAAGIDAVVVCSENSRHRTVIEQAAAEGIHVLCEKPLATTLEDAASIVRACETAGVIGMTAYPVRFHPDVAALKEAIDAGDLGRILTVVGTDNGQAPFASRRWFGDKDLAGGGALIDHIVHLADLVDLLLRAVPVEVYAQVNRIAWSDAVDVETGGLVMMTLSDGTVVTLDCSWSMPRSYDSWGGLTLTIDGENGTTSFDPFAESIEVYEDAAGTLRRDATGVDLDAQMLEEFVDAVRHGRRAAPGLDVGYRTLQVVDAAYRSVATGRPVAVDVSR